MKAKQLLAGTALAVAITLGGCGSLGQNIDMTRLGSALQKGQQAMSLSNAEVMAYAQQAVAKMDAENKVAPSNNKYAQRLAKLTNGINSVGDIPLNFKVYITDDINAFACADGSVRVYSGIMDLMTDDELMGIIGHEIGHVANEDSKDAFKNALLNSALSDALGSTNSKVAALTDSQLGQLAQSLGSAKYSRKQENEADVYGYQVLKQLGKNPYAMVTAFEKMQQLEQTTGQVTGSLANMFSDHPNTADRIKNIKALCVKDGYTK